MKYITVVIQYEDDDEEPTIHGFMPCLGGEVIAVQFNNALATPEDE
jgi:hypothetical protein